MSNIFADTFYFNALVDAQGRIPRALVPRRSPWYLFLAPRNTRAANALTPRSFGVRPSRSGPSRIATPAPRPTSATCAYSVCRAGACVGNAPFLQRIPRETPHIGELDPHGTVVPRDVRGGLQP